MPEGVKDVVKEKIVEVEKYDEPGDIYLNFFPNDKVRVVITTPGTRIVQYGAIVEVDFRSRRKHFLKKQLFLRPQRMNSRELRGIIAQRPVA